MARAILPPGQFEIDEFPAFGLERFARRLPMDTARIRLAIQGDVEWSITVEDGFGDLPRVDQTSDLHCVTTWTRRGLTWSGVRFADFYERIVVPRARPRLDATFVILRGRDGYAPGLPLSDLLAPDVLLADRLQGTAALNRARRAAAPGGSGPLWVQECEASLRRGVLAGSPSVPQRDLLVHGSSEGACRVRGARPNRSRLDSQVSVSPGDPAHHSRVSARSRCTKAKGPR